MTVETILLEMLPADRDDVIERLSDPATVVLVEELIDSLIDEGRIKADGRMLRRANDF
jgi:hypothetical protein